MEAPPGFPAHAGMDPSRRLDGRSASRLPRTRGDGPRGITLRRTPAMASPHTRGWTVQDRRRAPRDPGFPAHAGMDPGSWSGASTSAGLPRTRGDGPVELVKSGANNRASPHTRGWTREPDRRADALAGFPAHAGMDPGAAGSGHRRRRLPRTRGDGPPFTNRAAVERRAAGHGFPAHAGMDPRHESELAMKDGLPRTRGDGPYYEIKRQAAVLASPHTRGWTPVARRLPDRAEGFPAHAGMDPLRPAACSDGGRLHRDGPPAMARTAGSSPASPHTRGWTLHGARSPAPVPGFPAQAGRR